MKKRKHYTAEKKVLILRELLENDVPISELAEKFEVHPNDIYIVPKGCLRQKKKLFESATEIFKPNNTTKGSKRYEQNNFIFPNHVFQFYLFSRK